MPSILARLTKVFIGHKFSAGRNVSPEGALEAVFKNFSDQDKADPPPADIVSNEQFSLVEETYQLAGGQEWIVRHLAIKEGIEGAKQGLTQVIIYWHGGAFIHKASPISQLPWGATQALKKQATPHHWQFVRTILLQTGLPVVIPQYTKAPLATSTQSILGAISLILSISQDARYKDRDIVLMGDSAGGWFVMRLILALTELVLGEFRGTGADGFDKEQCKAARKKIKKGITISGVFELDLARTTFKEDELLQAKDPWLSQIALRAIVPLWTYGPHAVTPSGASRIPADCPALTHPDLIPSLEVPITDPRFTPTTGVEVLKRYVEQEKPSVPLRTIQAIGTSDILYNQNTRMYDALRLLEEEVVRPVLITEEGLFHVYPLVQFLPESQRAIKQFVQLLQEP